MNDPVVSVHAAPVAQLCVPAEHSLKVTHELTPSPEYPGLHTHVNDPGTLLQLLNVWQLSSPAPVHAFQGRNGRLLEREMLRET